MLAQGQANRKRDTKQRAKDRKKNASRAMRVAISHDKILRKFGFKTGRQAKTTNSTWYKKVGTLWAEKSRYIRPRQTETGDKIKYSLIKATPSQIEKLIKSGAIARNQTTPNGYFVFNKTGASRQTRKVTSEGYIKTFYTRNKQRFCEVSIPLDPLKLSANPNKEKKRGLKLAKKQISWKSSKITQIKYSSNGSVGEQVFNEETFLDETQDERYKPLFAYLNDEENENTISISILVTFLKLK